MLVVSVVVSTLITLSTPGQHGGCGAAEVILRQTACIQEDLEECRRTTHFLQVSPSHPHTLTHSHPHSLTHSHTHPHTLTPSHTHPHTLTPSHTHPHTLTPSHTHPHTLTPSHTHPHTLTPSQTPRPGCAQQSERPLPPGVKVQIQRPHAATDNGRTSQETARLSKVKVHTMCF